MICKYCNSEIQDNSVICPSCGKRLVKNSLLSQLYKVSEIPRRYYLCGLALLVAGIISLLSFMATFNKDAYLLKENSITYETDGESTVFYFNDKELDSENIKVEHVSESMYGDVVAFFDAASVKQENDETASSVYTLYFADNDGVHKVAENVIDYRISPNGRYIVYIDSVKELNLYNCSKNTAEEIDHNVLRENLCVADDGAIVYLKKETDGEYMHICKGGRSVQYFENDREPVSVSNGAKDVYMLDSADSLYYYNGNDEVKVASDVSAYCFDEKGDDIFYHSEGKSFVYGGRGDPRELAESELVLVTCDNTAVYKSDNVIYYGVSDFDEKYYVSGDGKLYYVDGRYSVSQVADSVDEAQSTVDGKSVVYVRQGKLISHMSSSKSDVEIADNVAGFAMTDDARYIYFVNDSAELYVKFGKKDPERLAENVVDFDITVKDHVFFTVLKDDKYQLFAVKGSGDIKCVREGLASAPEIDHSSVTYADGDDVYASAGDLKFNKR